MAFEFEPLEIPEVVLVRTTVHEDHRGTFTETYKRSAFVAGGIADTFVQENVARSTRGILRGLHFQTPPAAQGKLMSVVRGAIYDVAVDLRAGSGTYGGWVAWTLEEGAGEMLWVPPGFAHGYLVLTDVADVAYRVTAEFAPAQDGGVRWNDPDIGIPWPVDDPVLSEKDRAQPLLSELDAPFPA